MNQKELSQQQQDQKRFFGKRIQHKALSQAYERMIKYDMKIMDDFVTFCKKLGNLNEEEQSQYLNSKQRFKKNYIRELKTLTTGWNTSNKEKLRNTKWDWNIHQKTIAYNKKHLLDECVLN